MRLAREIEVDGEIEVVVKNYRGNKDLERGIFGLDKLTEPQLNELGYCLVEEVIDRRTHNENGYLRFGNKYILQCTSKGLVLEDVINTKIADLNAYFRPKISEIVYPYTERKEFEAAYIIPDEIKSARLELVTMCHGHKDNINSLTDIVEVLDYDFTV